MITTQLEGLLENWLEGRDAGFSKRAYHENMIASAEEEELERPVGHRSDIKKGITRENILQESSEVNTMIKLGLVPLLRRRSGNINGIQIVYDAYTEEEHETYIEHADRIIQEDNVTRQFLSLRNSKDDGIVDIEITKTKPLTRKQFLKSKNLFAEEGWMFEGNPINQEDGSIDNVQVNFDPDGEKQLERMFSTDYESRIERLKSLHNQLYDAETVFGYLTSFLTK